MLLSSLDCYMLYGSDAFLPDLSCRTANNDLYIYISSRFLLLGQRRENQEADVVAKRVVSFVELY